MKTLKSRHKPQRLKAELHEPVPINGSAEKLLGELRKSGYAELRSIEVSFEASVITMCGVVQTFYAKQLAQEIAKRTYPDSAVDNRITVVSINRQA